MFSVLQTPSGLLLTPSPLLSSIHFWSSLSPVAPLSPARLQGPNTLFQVGLPNTQVPLLEVHVEAMSGEHLMLVWSFSNGLRKHGSWWAFLREVCLPAPPLEHWQHSPTLQHLLCSRNIHIAWRKQRKHCALVGRREPSELWGESTEQERMGKPEQFCTILLCEAGLILLSQEDTYHPRDRIQLHLT